MNTGCPLFVTQLLVAERRCAGSAQTISQAVINSLARPLHNVLPAQSVSASARRTSTFFGTQRGGAARTPGSLFGFNPSATRPRVNLGCVAA